MLSNSRPQQEDKVKYLEKIPTSCPDLVMESWLSVSISPCAVAASKDSCKSLTPSTCSGNWPNVSFLEKLFPAIREQSVTCNIKYQWLRGRRFFWKEIPEDTSNQTEACVSHNGECGGLQGFFMIRKGHFWTWLSKLLAFVPALASPFPN